MADGSGEDDEGHLFVSSAQQREHLLSELAAVEAEDLGTRLGVVEGHLPRLHVQEHTHLTQFGWSLDLVGEKEARKCSQARLSNRNTGHPNI